MKQLICILICCCILTCLPAMSQKAQTKADISLQESVEKLEKAEEEISRQLDSLRREIDFLKKQESFRDECAQAAQGTFSRTLNYLAILATVLGAIITIFLALGWLDTKRKLKAIDERFKKKSDEIDQKFEMKNKELDLRLGEAKTKVDTIEKLKQEAADARSKAGEESPRSIEEPMSPLYRELAKRLEDIERLGGTLSSSDYMTLAKDYFEKQMFFAALDAIEKVIDREKRNAVAWSNRGVVLSRLNQHEDALISSIRATSIDPNMANAWYNKGVTLGKLNRHKEALEAYEKAIELKPKYVEAWFNKGVTLGELDRHREALVAHKKAIELKPDFAEAWYAKGVTLGKLNRPLEEQLTTYEKAIEYKPDFADAWYNKGVTLRELNRSFEEQLAAYQKVIDYQENYAEAWYNRACIYTFKGDKDLAIANLSKAIELKPSSKEKARKDEDFHRIKDDKVFKKLVGE